jgi:hypothetical protein
LVAGGEDPVQSGIEVEDVVQRADKGGVPAGEPGVGETGVEVEHRVECIV